MLRRVGILVCALGLLSSPSWAQDAEEEGREIDLPARSAVVHTDEDGDGEAERLICRRMQTTGSRRIQRYCFTQEEWTSMRDDHTRDMRQNDRDNTVTLDPNEGRIRTVGTTTER